jgi:hypothetical protein
MLPKKLKKKQLFFGLACLKLSAMIIDDYNRGMVVVSSEDFGSGRSMEGDDDTCSVESMPPFPTQGIQICTLFHERSNVVTGIA